MVAYRLRALTAVSFIALSLFSAPSAHATTAPSEDEPETAAVPVKCDAPSPVFTTSKPIVSSKATNIKSAYITGPGTLSWNKSSSVTVQATVSSTAKVDLSAILLSVGGTYGASLSASKSWNEGFTYSVAVPSGQRRAMQLFHESRSFVAAKKVLKSPCTYVTTYTAQSINAPIKAKELAWKLVK